MSNARFHCSKCGTQVSEAAVINGDCCPKCSVRLVVDANDEETARIQYGWGMLLFAVVGVGLIMRPLVTWHLSMQDVLGIPVGCVLVLLAWRMWRKVGGAVGSQPTKRGNYFDLR